MAEREGYFSTWRGDRHRYLYNHKPDALRLLQLLQDRAKYTDGWDPHGLKKGQAFIGFSDVKPWKWTEKKYRKAKKDLEKVGVMVAHGGGAGTVVTLLDTVHCIDIKNNKGGQEGGQEDRQGADHGRTEGQAVGGQGADRGAPNKEGKKEIKEEGNNPPNPSRGAEGGGILSSEAENLRVRILEMDKVRKGQLSPEAWALILKSNPEFDPADEKQVDALLSEVACMDKKISGPASWFASKMGRVTKGVAPEPEPDDYPNFQKWFDLYPKSDLIPGLRSWVAADLEAKPVGDLIHVLQLQLKSDEWGEGGTFAPSAKNYIEDRRYLDSKDSFAKKTKHVTRSEPKRFRHG